MVYIILIVVILFAILTIISAYYAKDTLATIFFILFVVSIIIFIIVGSVSYKDIQGIKSNDIPAIEVYRGNTTLQITYEDSIPIDSVVVYKNK